MKKINQSILRLRRQWLIGHFSDIHPEGWQNMILSDSLKLSWHADLQVKEVRGNDCLVLVLGQLVHTKILSKDAPTIYERDSLVEWLEGAAGVYVVIQIIGGSVEIFTDPSGLMGVYYKEGRASSSPSLLPDFKLDESIIREYPLKGTDDWFTGSITPFHGISYLLANHSLNVKLGTIKRFWPSGPVVKESLKKGIAEAATLMRSIVNCVSNQGNILLSLTGGKDSRVNLAASREIIGEINCFTLKGKGVKKWDIEIPVLLSERFGLNHRFVDISPSEDWLLEMYDEISGGIALGARRDILTACLQFEEKNAIHLSGNLGAIAKAYYWRSESPSTFDRSLIVRDFINLAPCIERGVDEWISSLPPNLPADMIYNLMYLEQRGGRWTGVGENASSLFYQPFSAFNSRKLFLAINKIPNKYQYLSDLHEELIAYLWPELLEIPFGMRSRSFSALIPKRLKDLIKQVIRWG